MGCDITCRIGIGSRGGADRFLTGETVGRSADCAGLASNLSLESALEANASDFGRFAERSVFDLPAES